MFLLYLILLTRISIRTNTHININFIYLIKKLFYYASVLEYTYKYIVHILMKRPDIRRHEYNYEETQREGDVCETYLP